VGSTMAALKFTQVIGTGGIGGGILFELEGNRALSRNETRLASLSPAKDYCKLHIILHYIARILVPEAAVHAIGAVGSDRPGAELTEMMKQAGIGTAFVRCIPDKPTMYAVCLQYPDKSVCNITTAGSASSLVSEGDVEAAFAGLSKPVDGETAAIAVPEVPLGARLALLRRAKAAGAFCVASFLSDEAQAFVDEGGLQVTDLLVLNEDEAAAFCGEVEKEPSRLAWRCYEKLRLARGEALLAVTFGALGSYACREGTIRYLPAQPVKAVATGGAGDAYLAGIVCGLALGLPFLPESGASAAGLGSRLAAESVKVMDTIAGHIDRELALRLVEELGKAEG